MGLNIKNAETTRLARELARLTGETLTGAIDTALRERLGRERMKRDAAGTIERVRQIRAEVDPRDRLAPGEDATAGLYDDRGLPG